MTMTFLSVLAALIIGGLETLNLIDKLELKGSFWEAVGAINDNFGIFGYVIIGIFIATWAISALFYFLMDYDRLEPLPATSRTGSKPKALKRTPLTRNPFFRYAIMANSGNPISGGHSMRNGDLGHTHGGEPRYSLG